MEDPIIQLNGWQTIKSYAKANGYPTQYIYKLIKQGKVESRTIVELNNLKLVLPPKAKN